MTVAQDVAEQAIRDHVNEVPFSLIVSTCAGAVLDAIASNPAAVVDLLELAGWLSAPVGSVTAEAEPAGDFVYYPPVGNTEP